MQELFQEAQIDVGGNRLEKSDPTVTAALEKVINDFAHRLLNY
jgi:hypothetical protein